MYILTLNCGSSSVKYQLYDWNEKEILAKGAVERVTVGGSFIEHYKKDQPALQLKHECPDHSEAISLILHTLTKPKVGALSDIHEIKAVGHRVVHGGEKFSQSVIVNDEALKVFKEMCDLSPLHNPANILGIEAARRVLPDVPHCVSMDTAWHQTMPAAAYIYALPYSWYEKYSIRRYGFHGTSFLYVAKRAAVLLGKDPFKTNLIILHLGNGASANAVKNGCSIDTSMGLTPLEGLIMGTRSGDHDPAIDFYMMRKENYTADQIESILNKKSGLLGITGSLTDMRDIMRASVQGDKLAALAIEMVSYRLKKYIGAYYAALGSVDAIVFAAGIGETNPLIRQKTLENLGNFGIHLDEELNTLAVNRNIESIISAPHSAVKVFVIPTDEELVMTEDTHALLHNSYDVHTNFTYSFQDRQYINKERAQACQESLKTNPALKKIIAPIP